MKQIALLFGVAFQVFIAGPLHTAATACPKFVCYSTVQSSNVSHNIAEIAFTTELLSGQTTSVGTKGYVTEGSVFKISAVAYLHDLINAVSITSRLRFVDGCGGTMAEFVLSGSIPSAEQRGPIWGPSGEESCARCASSIYPSVRICPFSGLNVLAYASSPTPGPGQCAFIFTTTWTVPANDCESCFPRVNSLINGSFNVH